MFIIEIALVIAAWKRGWGSLALLPFGITLAAGFLIGMAMGASGASEAEIEQAGNGFGVFAEIAVLATLGIMAAVGRRTHAAGGAVAGAGRNEAFPSAEAAAPEASPSLPADTPRDRTPVGSGASAPLAGTVR